METVVNMQIILWATMFYPVVAISGFPFPSFPFPFLTLEVEHLHPFGHLLCAAHLKTEAKSNINI